MKINNTKVINNIESIREELINDLVSSDYYNFYSGSLFVLGLIESEFMESNDMIINLENRNEIKDLIHEIVDSEELYLFIVDNFIRKK